MLWFIVFTSVRFLLLTVMLGVLVVRVGQYWSTLYVAPPTVRRWWRWYDLSGAAGVGVVGVDESHLYVDGSAGGDDQRGVECGYVSGEFAEDTEDGVVSALVIEVVWNGNGRICDGGDDGV